MSKKNFELINIYGSRGSYKAVMYNRIGGYFEEAYFFDYSKKEILYRLRHNYDCIVRRGNY